MANLREVTRDCEEAAIDKLRVKLERDAPAVRDDDKIVNVKLTIHDLRALRQMWMRNGP